MVRKLLLAALGIAAACIGAAQPATFGIRVPIGGEATDLAIDQPRGVLYIANFTASRIDRMNLATFQLQAPIPVDPYPVSMSLSPDRRWLLVAHYDNPKTGTPTNNHLTLLDLVLGTRKTLAMPEPPLAVSFGADNQAFARAVPFGRRRQCGVHGRAGELCHEQNRPERVGERTHLG